MQTSKEMKAHLNSGALELCEIEQLLATALDRVQTAADEIRMCHDRADLVDSTVDALNREILTVNEEMDRVNSLRNNESDLYLRQENAHLKRDIAAMQQALRREMEEHKAQLTESVKSNEDLTRRIRKLEHFNELLKVRINEMKEKYESAIIDNLDLRDTVKSLQNTPAFNVIADTASSSYANRGTSPGPTPFGKTVVETNRGLTVTIESSRDSSPEKASLHHGWLPELPSGATIPFPEIFPRPQSMTPTPDNSKSPEIAIRTPGGPKARGIVKGTPEANESFERMKRSFLSSPLPNISNIINNDNNAATSSSSASGHAMPIIRPFSVHPVTPSKLKSKLNPAVEAFTPSNPSNSSGKDSLKSGSMQAASPSKTKFDASVNASNAKDEGFVPPHLRRRSNVSIKEEPSVKDTIKDQGTVASSAQSESSKQAESLQVTSLTPRILPHLRRQTNFIKNEDVPPSQVQPTNNGKNKETTIEGGELMSRDSALTSMKENLKPATTPGASVKPDPGLQAWLDSQEEAQSKKAISASVANDTLIEIDPESPKAGKKTVPLPPGFIPISTKNAPVKSETAAPIKTDKAVSPISADDPFIHRNPTDEDKSAAPGHEVSANATSEKEKNAAFMAEYNKGLSSISAKYGKDSRKSSDAKEDDRVDPPQFIGGEPSYNPPKPTGTHELGTLLDAASYRMVMKPRTEDNVEEEAIGQQWKAVRKDGRVVYVL